MRWLRQPTYLTSSARSERNLAAWILLCALLLWAAMCGPYLAGRVYTSDDLGAFHLPLRNFYAQCLARGDAFDWCPQLYSGFYLTGEGQVGMYHPLRWLLYRFVSFPAAFDLELLLSYPLMLAGTYLFLRRHVTNRAAAMFGAVVFTFCGFNTLRFVHTHAIAIVAHLPWLLWCWGGAVRAVGWVEQSETHQNPSRDADWRRACFLTGIALLTTSQVLLGYPQYVWFSLLAQAAYSGLLWRQSRITVWDALGFAAALALGVLAGAVQWLPTWDWLADSQRQHVDSSFALTGSLHPLNLLQLISPYLFQTRVAGGNTHELGLYIGAVPLMLVVWMLSRRDAAPRSRFLKFLFGLTLVAFILALGSNGGLYVLQTWLPLIGKLRMPARYLMLVHFGLAAIASVALARLMESRTDSADPWCRTLIKTVAASVLLALVAPWVWTPEELSALWWAYLGPLQLAAAAGAIVLCLRQARGAYALLTLIAVIDLGGYGLSYGMLRNTVRWEDYLAAGAPPTFTDGFRVAVEVPGATLRTGNHLIVRGLRQVDGYAGLEPHRQLDYSQAPALQVAGVQWVLDRDANRWMEVPHALPRVRLVRAAVVSHNPREDLAEIDFTAEALVDRPVALEGEEGAHHAERDGYSRLVEDRPGNLQLAVDVPSRQLLIVAESFHRGWTAEIDGRPAEVVRVNGDFLGCVVGPGDQAVRLVFRPKSLMWGWRLSIAGIIGIGLGLIWLLRPRFERQTQARPTIELERELALVQDHVLSP